FGLTPLTGPPGMFAEKLRPPSRKLPVLDVRRVNNLETRQAFANITAIAFDIPQAISREVYGAARGLGGDFHGYVGYVDGAPVATTATVVSAGAVGIYSVGTLPDWRRRGFAESLMRSAIAIEQKKSGVEASVLQATESGISVYERMGYRRVTRFSVYIS
ncbi:MAG: GNAT family N-acetyltransferase, partial [Bryobacteraceae bacterium]